MNDNLLVAELSSTTPPVVLYSGLDKRVVLTREIPAYSPPFAGVRVRWCGTCTRRGCGACTRRGHDACTRRGRGAERELVVGAVRALVVGAACTHRGCCGAYTCPRTCA
jgi:hypothetical protein